MVRTLVLVLFGLLAACTTTRNLSVNADYVLLFVNKTQDAPAYARLLRSNEQKLILDVVRDCSWVPSEEDPAVAAAILEFYRNGSLDMSAQVVGQQVFAIQGTEMLVCSVSEGVAEKLSPLVK